MIPEMFLRALVGKQVFEIMVQSSLALCRCLAFGQMQGLLCRKIIQTQFMTESVSVPWQ